MPSFPLTTFEQFGIGKIAISLVGVPPRLTPTKSNPLIKSRPDRAVLFFTTALEPY